MRTDMRLDTRGGGRGVRTHVRQSALTADSGRKILCRTGDSNLPKRRAGLALYQLSYIPTPFLCGETPGEVDAEMNILLAENPLPKVPSSKPGVDENTAHLHVVARSR